MSDPTIQDVQTLTVLENQITVVGGETVDTLLVTSNPQPVTQILTEQIPGPQGKQGEQGLPGPQGLRGDPGSSANILVSRSNADIEDLTQGMLVYASPNDPNGILRAQATDPQKKTVVGFIADPLIPAGGTGLIQVTGLLAMPYQQWDALTGMVGGLIQGQTYYLDAYRPGCLRFDPLTVSGQYFCPVGIALSQTEMMIEITRPILL